MNGTAKNLLNRFFLKKPKLRRFVTRVLEGDRDLTVRLLGESVRVNTIKEHGYLRAARFMASSSFLGDEIPVLLGIAYFLNGADAFVDVGSNVGVFCAVLGKFQRVRPIPFYAFEPNPDTYSRLLETVAPLGAEVFNYALSDRETVLDFVSGAVSHVFSAVDSGSEYVTRAKSVKVPCHRLDSLPIKGRSIFLKIDVEGHELQVLRGASKLFDDDRIFACYVDGFADPEIPKFLSSKGFRLFDGRSLEEKPKGDCYSLLSVRFKG